MSPAGAPATTAEVLRVLVVDDNASLLRFLVSAFSAHGCVVKQAGAAAQALEALGEQSFDLVVSDVTMPGLSGLDLLRAVKNHHPGTPVVLITGNPSVTSAVVALRNGAYDYLPKPFSIREIQDLLARVRADRLMWGGRLPLPAGFTDELSRRQSGMEGMLRIGDLARQGLDRTAFMEAVLRLIGQSIRSDGSLALLRDAEGRFVCSQHGDARMRTRLLTPLQHSFTDLVAGGARETVTIGVAGESLEMIAAVIPGDESGLIALARDRAKGGFLPDERVMVAGYAHIAAVALQTLAPPASGEGTLVTTITTFVNAMESKDPYLRGHSARVALYAVDTARALGLTPALVDDVSRGAMLHDLGKLSLMDMIFKKPDRLTADELTIINSHPIIGAKILEPLGLPGGEVAVVRHHHERFDGTGYPDRLRGAAIPLTARVVGVADAFDAMTSNRPHRAPLGIAAAREEIAAGRGSHFDPAVADALLGVSVACLEKIKHHDEAVPDRSATSSLAEVN
jgi:putative nucleotidyltransferase with HDIG domain